MVRLLGEPWPHEELARTGVLGLGGCMFVGGRSLGRGTLMELLISLKGSVIRTDAQVVYEIERAPARYEIGVEFLRLSRVDQARIGMLMAAEPEALH